MGIKLKGRALWACNCLSVLRSQSVADHTEYVREKLLMKSWFAHPISPYALHVNRRTELLAQFLHQCLSAVYWIFSSASQASRASWALSVFEIIIVELIFCIAYDCCSSFGGSRQGSR